MIVGLAPDENAEKMDMKALVGAVKRSQVVCDVSEAVCCLIMMHHCLPPFLQMTVLQHMIAPRETNPVKVAV